MFTCWKGPRFLWLLQIDLRFILRIPGSNFQSQRSQCVGRPVAISIYKIIKIEKHNRRGLLLIFRPTYSLPTTCRSRPQSNNKLLLESSEDLFSFLCLVLTVIVLYNYINYYCSNDQQDQCNPKPCGSLLCSIHSQILHSLNFYCYYSFIRGNFG